MGMMLECSHCPPEQPLSPDRLLFPLQLWLPSPPSASSRLSGLLSIPQTTTRFLPNS